MKTRRQKDYEDTLTISRRNTQSPNSKNGRENTELIPIDLIFEILLRLPTKSIARCRCVSKLWSLILIRPDFTELFLTRSSTLPQLLFSYKKNNELFFFTAPQFQNPNENSSLVVSPSYHMKVPFDHSSRVCGHVRGLLCLTHHRLEEKGRKETVPMICNPSTGQASLPLPKVKTRRVMVKSFFVYDPIGKLFKVLSCPFYRDNDKNCKEYQVLTLGTQTLSWRMIDCCIPHHPSYDGICIDGCLYYQAMVSWRLGISTIVCFDVRSEKFRFVNKATGMGIYDELTLVNYEGRLGAIHQSDGHGTVNSQTISLELWVLVDAEKHEWSKHVYVLPPMWKNLVAEAAELYIVGRTDTNEIVLSARYSYDNFYVFYYNPERNTIVRVEVQGTDEFKHRRVHTFINHVEDVKLLHYIT